PQARGRGLPHVVNTQHCTGRRQPDRGPGAEPLRRATARPRWLPAAVAEWGVAAGRGWLPTAVAEWGVAAGGGGCRRRWLPVVAVGGGGLSTRPRLGRRPALAGRPVRNARRRPPGAARCWETAPRNLLPPPGWGYGRGHRRSPRQAGPTRP